MPKQEGWIVVLTEEGVAYLKDNLTKHLLFDNSYFTCDLLHQDSSFLVLEGVHLPPPGEKNFDFDLQIPFSTVRYIVSGIDRNNVFGFNAE